MAITPVFVKNFILEILDDPHFRGINCEEEKKNFNLQRNRKYEWEEVNATFLDMRMNFVWEKRQSGEQFKVGNIC